MLFDREKLTTFPALPGVYIMKGRGDSILYIGKAKNLRVRVRQYFLPGGDGRVMIPFLIERVEAVETIVVTSEKEALLLENNLIKQHKPRFNALLKDDKTYTALKVTNKNKWPMLALVRYKGQPKADGVYFGPYVSALAARKTFDLLNRLFPLRQCSDQELARRTRPCILYDMKRCIAPCVGKCTKEEYDQHVERTIKFLKGQDKEVVNDLYQEMQKASDSMEYERASAILQTIRQIEATLEEQRVDKPLGIDIDALAIFRQGEEVILNQFIFRGGKLMGSSHYDFANIAEEDHELLESFLVQHYQKQNELPHEILLPLPLDDAETISDIISLDKRRRSYIYAPQRGDKKILVEMAFANAETLFKKEKDAQTIREKTLLELQEKFSLSRYPKRIECFDNSNLAGKMIVSSLVAFTNGVKDTSRYRKYKIRTIETSDDYGAMREAMERRYRRAKEENNLPDLLIVDGGKGHLNAALKVMSDLNIVSVDVISVAKEEGRHDKGMTAEQVFLPNLKDPILLKRTSPILFLLQQIRDEAHRTAIGFHRKLRSKKNLRSVIDDISGVGPVKRKALLSHFGSVKKLLQATLEDLTKVSCLNKRDIQVLMDFIAQSNK